MSGGTSGKRVGHGQRMQRVRLSLEGLSLGDGFGGRHFFPGVLAGAAGQRRPLPAGPWHYTDDTVMALAIAAVLDRHAGIDQDQLAAEFAKRYREEPGRGYGRGARGILETIGKGSHWREAAGSAFGGKGSMGNGAAMRVAPLGAYFARDLERLTAEAVASAEVTHAHPEGQAGAVAVALAAAFAWLSVHEPGRVHGLDLLGFVLERMPPGETRDGVARARNLPGGASAKDAARELGSGNRVTSQDTVPFVLWVASRRLRDFEEALFETVAGQGDMDTTCAIVGGIVALAVGETGLPREWLRRREPLP